MKKILTICYVSLAAAFILPLFLRAVPESAPPDLELPPLTSAAPEPAPIPAPEPTARAEMCKTIAVLADGASVEMNTTDYLTGVVAAEMPASFNVEALKAQAVAARSYAMYCALQQKHGAAQVCTDSACCQAYLGREALRERWGADFEEYYGKISAAVRATAGEYLAYEGEPVLAVFHSSSAGRTAASGSVWNAVPYLLSVTSPESADTVPGYISSMELSPLDFRDTLLALCPEADFSGEESGWIGECRRDESGRVESIRLGGAEFTGAELRSAFRLRSTAFELAYTGAAFRFTVTGYGHGVGMSQYGANVMAGQGSDYREILLHYYPGTELTGSD